jgi:hypothetical protein
MNFAELYPVMGKGELLSGGGDHELHNHWKLASAEQFNSVA